MGLLEGMGLKGPIKPPERTLSKRPAVSADSLLSRTISVNLAQLRTKFGQWKSVVLGPRTARNSGTKYCVLFFAEEEWTENTISGGPSSGPSEILTVGKETEFSCRHEESLSANPQNIGLAAWWFPGCQSNRSAGR